MDLCFLCLKVVHGSHLSFQITLQRVGLGEELNYLNSWCIIDSFILFSINHKLQVWRHSCISLSRITGRFKLIENGQIIDEKYSDEIVQYMQRIPVEVHKNYLGPTIWSRKTFLMSLVGYYLVLNYFTSRLASSHWAVFIASRWSSSCPCTGR